MDEETVRKVLFQLDMGKKQMEQLSRQGQMIEAALNELNSSVETLETLKTLKPGVEIQVQVGAGTYVKASLKDTENVLVGIGAEMSVEKTLAEAIATLEGRKKLLTESFSSVQKALGDLSIKVAELSAQAEQMMGQMQPR